MTTGAERATIPAVLGLLIALAVAAALVPLARRAGLAVVEVWRRPLRSARGRRAMVASASTDYGLRGLRRSSPRVTLAGPLESPRR